MWFGRKKQDPAEVAAGLRENVFSVKPEEIGLVRSPAARVWGLVLETGYDEGAATLIAFRDGTTSLYFSSGGGVIGAGEHDTVRTASLEWLDSADAFLAHFVPTSQHPLPGRGRVRFYARTFDGLLFAEANEDDLGEERHPLSPLFYGGHRVITRLREAAP